VQVTIFAVGLVTLLAGTIAASSAAEKTTKPILQLTRTVKRISDGDLDARILPTTRDEVGDLTRMVNEMIGAIRESLAVSSRERAGRQV